MGDMSPMDEIPAQNPKKITRRQLLDLVGLGLGAKVFSGLAQAQDARTFTEANREISITPDADRIMKEWGIRLEGSEIHGPVDFLDEEQVLSGRNPEDFHGICLTNEAVSVSIDYSTNSGTYLAFLVTNKDGTMETFGFRPIISGLPRRVFLRPNAKGFKRGPCHVEIS